MAKILLVEDYPSLLQIYTAQLLRDSHEVDGVPSAEKALELMAHTRYDLIITDVLLPGVSGLQMLNKAEQEIDLSATKILVITNFPDDDKLHQSQNLGVDKFVQKSEVTPKELSDLVQDLLAAPAT